MSLRFVLGPNKLDITRLGLHYSAQNLLVSLTLWCLFCFRSTTQEKWQDSGSRILLLVGIGKRTQSKISVSNTIPNSQVMLGLISSKTLSRLVRPGQAEIPKEDRGWF